MGKWSASTAEKPKLLKNDFPFGNLSSLLLVTYLYLIGLQLLLETLGWNIFLTWLSSWGLSPAPAPAPEI